MRRRAAKATSTVPRSQVYDPEVRVVWQLSLESDVWMDFGEDQNFALEGGLAICEEVVELNNAAGEPLLMMLVDDLIVYIGGQNVRRVRIPKAE